MSTNIIVDAIDVTKQYGDFKALEGLSLQVERGGVWALLVQTVQVKLLS